MAFANFYSRHLMNLKSLNGGMKYPCKIRNLQYLFDLCTQFQFSFPVSLKQLGRKVEMMMLIYHHNHVTMVTIINNVNNIAVIFLILIFCVGAEWYGYYQVCITLTHIVHDS